MYRKLLFMVMTFSIGMVLLPQTQSPVVQAQDGDSDAEWEMVFYSKETFDFITVTEAEISEIVEFGGNYFDRPFRDRNYGAIELKLSPTRHRIAAVFPEYPNDMGFATERLTSNLNIYHLEDKEGLDEYDIPRPPISYGARVDITSVAFSPDGRHIALAFVYDAENQSRRGGIFTFQPGWDKIDHHIMSVEGDDYWFARNLEWSENGIYFQWSQLLGMPQQWYDYRWVPGTSDFIATHRFHDVYPTSDTLALTNELVSIDAAYDYPNGVKSTSSVPGGNVLRYYQDAAEWRNREDFYQQLIYWDEHDYVATQPHWALDGAGVVMLVNDDLHVLILRDGTQIEIEATTHQIWGTPTGWLGYNHENGALIHYSYTPENGVTEHEVGRWLGELYLLEAPDLGNASTSEFATITEHDWGEPVCEGALPTRFDIGSTGIGNKGFLNNIHARPDEGSLVFGQVSTDEWEFFTVVDGYECNQNMTWWKVLSGDGSRRKIGWITEGRDNYAVQPRATNVFTAEDLENMTRSLRDIYYTEYATLSCPGYLNPIQLSIGDIGQVLSGDPNNIREEPFMDAEFISQIPGEGVFTVLDGPRCSSDVAWWKVDYNGTVGWTGEGIRNIYWVEPYTPDEEISAPTVTTCEGFLPSRLSVGTTAQVTAGAANNVRSEARYDAELVGQIPGEASFTILDGPVCGENSAWWQVEYEGITGWTAEGQGDAYWLEP